MLTMSTLRYIDAVNTVLEDVMAELIRDRVCAEVDGEIVVFLIGMRINRPWKPWRWLPIFGAMTRMLRELAQQPELGLLASRTHFDLRSPMLVQYWRSAADLQAYAQAPDKQHLPAWQAFNRMIGTNGDVGIWHETYVVPAGHSESVYVNMPRYGLGLAGTLFAAKGARASAAKRLTGAIRG
jgi:hypothetical protein